MSSGPHRARVCLTVGSAQSLRYVAQSAEKRWQEKYYGKDGKKPPASSMALPETAAQNPESDCK